MPSPRPVLGAGEAGDLVRLSSFAPGNGGRVGVELEWLAAWPHRPHARPHPEHLHAALDGQLLPGGSRVTVEPGGQLELSSRPAHGPAAASALAAADLAAARTALAAQGIELQGVGLDPHRPPARVVHLPRYAAMEAFFAADGPAGRTMMCNTAAIQVNVDAGPEPGWCDRWRLAHAIGPVLAAAFANSPIAQRRPTGWRSTRLATWAAVDPSRTLPVDLRPGEGPLDAWCRYALEARVMLIRVRDDDFVPVTDRRLSFARWRAEGHELGWPTADDLRYHLTTLFPPVRPRGWLELRMIDALPDPWWPVAVAVSAALLDDPAAAEAATRATAGTGHLWVAAARVGLRHPDLARAASACFAAALAALPRLGAGRALCAAVAAYAEEFVAQSRCPADGLLLAREPSWT